MMYNNDAKCLQYAVAISWTLSISTFLVIIFGMYRRTQPNYYETALESAFYQSMTKVGNDFDFENVITLLCTLGCLGNSFSLDNILMPAETRIFYQKVSRAANISSHL